jgi:hypothetical protein
MSGAFLRHRGSLACVVAIALTATACGSSSGSSSAGAAATTTAAAAGTTAAATTTAAPVAATTTKVKATGGGSFCKEIATALNNAASAGNASTVDAEKAEVKQGLDDFANLAQKAPSSLKPDVLVLAAAVTKLYAAVAKANYDFSKLTEADLTAMSTPAVTAAEGKVDTYVKTTCGIDLGAAASSAAG